MRCFKFVGKNGFLFDENKKQLEDVNGRPEGEFKATSFQKKILRKNSSLENVFIGRFGMMEENGNWKLDTELKNKLI